ncbi:MAG TPA: DUF1996 domain-containing protein [Gaiellaceae bacterium]|nr:DUF1996 domain-containing protein [Gaiellaceae bacterium]
MRPVAFLLALMVVPVAAGAGLAARGVERAPSARALAGVNFVSACGFSHRAADDPIVSPGRPGASHDHTFVGNRSTSAGSTLRSLLAAETTCRRAGDTAAYWAPTLLRDGRAVEPAGATVYYRRRTQRPVQAFPPGFRMIAGTARAQAPQGRRITFWSCGALAGAPPSAEPPACPPGRATALRLHVRFPDCWDGRSLDSADHQSHVAYSRRGRCPRTHPVAVPALALILRYPDAGGVGLALSSGGVYSAHADFFNAWRQEELERLVAGCLNALRHCGRGA